MTCGCKDAHLRMGHNLTYEDVRSIATANGNTVDQILATIAETARIDRNRHTAEYDQVLQPIVGKVGVSPDWDRRQWAGEDVQPGEQGNRWEAGEWAGKEGPVGEPSIAPAGASGPTGGGHNPGEQHWAPPPNK